MNTPKPQHTAEEVADYLRREIAERDERLRDIAERRERMNNRFEEQREAASDEAERARITSRWAEAQRDKDVEAKVADAERFALRRTLQYLTGELWS